MQRRLCVMGALSGVIFRGVSAVAGGTDVCFHAPKYGCDCVEPCQGVDAMQDVPERAKLPSPAEVEDWMSVRANACEASRIDAWVAVAPPKRAPVVDVSDGLR